MQLVKSRESPYIYKVLQNSEKTGKTRVRMKEIRDSELPKSKIFRGEHAPGPPQAVLSCFQKLFSLRMSLS